MKESFEANCCYAYRLCVCICSSSVTQTSRGEPCLMSTSHATVDVRCAVERIGLAAEKMVLWYEAVLVLQMGGDCEYLLERP
jgi:hypothetical protein